MKITYLNKRPRGESLALIEHANTIIAEYDTQGFTLTVRQLYYQFVARGLIANTLRSYNKIQRITNIGRLAGLIDWLAIEDRTRYLRSTTHWENPQEILRSCAAGYTLDTREGQEYYVEVWIEKDALVGVIESICRSKDVTYFACRGYTSVSEVWRAAERFKDKHEQRVVVLHLGDHDPSGLDMTRDIQARLETFERADVEVRRIALTMAQVEELNSPPNPVKQTDSRCQGYVEEYGAESWELDALPPAYIAKLLAEQIDSMTDFDKRMKQLRLQAKHRKQLSYVADNWETLLKKE